MSEGEVTLHERELITKIREKVSKEKIFEFPIIIQIKNSKNY